MIDSPFEQLLDLVDRLAADHSPGDETLARETLDELARLVTAGMADGSIDRELRVDATSRWLVGLAAARREVRATDPALDADDDLAQLRMIATRWLHPARPSA